MYHCRECGTIVSSSCSRHTKVTLYALDSTLTKFVRNNKKQPQRVCDNCFYGEKSSTSGYDICGGCKRFLLPHAKFCSHCGKNVTDPSSKRTLSSTGAGSKPSGFDILSLFEDWCNQCGQSVSKPAVKHCRSLTCNEELKSGDEYCHSCGHLQSSSNQQSSSAQMLSSGQTASSVSSGMTKDTQKSLSVSAGSNSEDAAPVQICMNLEVKPTIWYVLIHFFFFIYVGTEIQSWR